MSIQKVFAVPAFFLAALVLQAQTSQKITGTVTDAMCGKKHMMKGLPQRNAPERASRTALTLPS